MLTKRNRELIGERVAIFSDDMIFRFALDIVWDSTKPPMTLIGLNPSTADEMKDDKTVTRCRIFAASWGYGGLLMRNLFAYRETDRLKMLGRDEDVTGNPENDYQIVEASRRSVITIVAWGNEGTHRGRDHEVMALIPDLHCIRITQSGCPEHPLYLPKNLKPIPFTAENSAPALTH